MNGHHPDTTEIFDFGGNSGHRTRLIGLLATLGNYPDGSAQMVHRVNCNLGGLWLSRGACGMMQGMRPDIIVLIILMLAMFIYALRHPDLDDWRGH